MEITIDEYIKRQYNTGCNAIEFFKKNNHIGYDTTGCIKIAETFYNMYLQDEYIELPYVWNPAIEHQSMLYFRDFIVAVSSWHLLNGSQVDAIKNVVGDKSVLEVMSGTGWLSYHLSHAGVNVIATDNYSWKLRDDTSRRYYDIEQMDALEALEKYGETCDFVIMSWPPYGDEIANRVLLKMREINKNARMIYIGEAGGGCTADDDFFDNAEIVSYEPVGKNQNFYGIRDDICIVK